MYENLTYDLLLQRSLERCKDSVDKREGSLIHTAVAMSCYEIAQMYVELDCAYAESYADTASRDFLIRRAKERGITPNQSTNAVLKGEFNISIDIGSRFTCDSLSYEVIELIDNSKHSYKLKCETSGIIGNSTFGTLIPVNYIQGLTSATLTDLLIPGEDEEDTESLRADYYESYDSQSFGGNRADYKKMFKDTIKGIGGIKLYRAWNGGGTVKIVCIDSTFKKPTEELITSSQEQVDPLENQGEGLGLAPIGHEVTLFAVDETKINISTNITFQSGWDFESCKPYILNAIDKYFLELNKTWSDNENLVVRVSHIETRLLNIEGILDISDTTLNGNAGNLLLESDFIAVRGDVIGQAS